MSDTEAVPLGQRLLEQPFLLLAAGLIGRGASGEAHGRQIRHRADRPSHDIGRDQSALEFRALVAKQVEEVQSALAMPGNDDRAALVVRQEFIEGGTYVTIGQVERLPAVAAGLTQVSQLSQRPRRCLLLVL